METIPSVDIAPQVPDKNPLWKVSPASGKYFVNSVAVSADGSRVLGGTFYHRYGPTELRRAPAIHGPASNSPEDGLYGTYCYDAHGNLLWKDEFFGWQGVYWVALSANGSRAAAGGFMSPTGQQGFIHAYDADRQGQLLLVRPTRQRVNQVALSADGSWLVSAAETLLLFHMAPGSNEPGYVQTAEFAPNSTSGIVSAAISADGRVVVYASYGGWIGVLSNDAGRLTPLAEWQVPGGKPADFCHMVDLAPDGKSFAAGGSNGQFYFFDIELFLTQRKPTIVHDTHVAGAVYGVAGAEDGSLFAGLVNRGDAGLSYLVRVQDDAPIQVQQSTLLRNPNSASLNARHGLYAIADGHPDGTPGHFYLYSGPAGGTGMPTLRWRFQAGNMSWPIVIAANGTAIVGGSDDSHIYYFTP